MKNSRICNLLLAALIVLLIAGAFVALVPQLTQTNVLQAGGPTPWPPAGSFDTPVPWPQPGRSIGING